jgi:hypothetical protein
MANESWCFFVSTSRDPELDHEQLRGSRPPLRAGGAFPSGDVASPSRGFVSLLRRVSFEYDFGKKSIDETRAMAVTMGPVTIVGSLSP